MLLLVNVVIWSLVAWKCVVAEDAYGDPQLGCGDTVIEEGSEATLSATFDVGDRPVDSYTLTIYKPGQCDDPLPWIMCGWIGNGAYNHHNACNESPTISKILGSTYQLKQSIPGVRKGDSGHYRVVLTVSTNEKEIVKKCDIVLLVVEGSSPVYGDPQLECGDTVIAAEGSEVTFSVIFDIGDRRVVSHTLTIDKPGPFGNAQPWIRCGWMGNDEYNHHGACNERPTISKILPRTYQLKKTNPSVRKRDKGHYSVSLTVSRDQKMITKKCDIVLLVVEASTTALRDPEKDLHRGESAAGSGSGEEEGESNGESMVIDGVVTALVVVSLLCLGALLYMRRRRRRRNRRSPTHDLNSVRTERSTGNATADPSTVSTQQPPQGSGENGPDPESTGLLNASNHNATER